MADWFRLYGPIKRIHGHYSRSPHRQLDVVARNPNIHFHVKLAAGGIRVHVIGLTEERASVGFESNRHQLRDRRRSVSPDRDFAVERVQA